MGRAHECPLNWRKESIIGIEILEHELIMYNKKGILAVRSPRIYFLKPSSQLREKLNAK